MRSQPAANCGAHGHALLDGNQIGPHQLTGRPNRVMAVKPMTVAESRLRMGWRAFKGRRERPPSAAHGHSRWRGHRQREQQPGPA